MIAYSFEFDASWLGGHAVIIAESEEDARRILESDLAQDYPDCVGCELVGTAETPGLVYFWDGDY